MDEQDQQYQYGFNSGYLIAKHESRLAEQLAKTPNNNSLYYQGLISGKEEYEREVREWSKTFSRKLGSRDEPEKGHER